MIRMLCSRSWLTAVPLALALPACTGKATGGADSGGDSGNDSGTTGHHDGGAADGGGADGGGADGGAAEGWSVQRRASLAPDVGNAVAPANIMVDGDAVWFSSSHSPVLGRVDLAAGAVDRLITLDEPPGDVSLAIDDQDDFLYFAAHDGSPLQRVDLTTDTVESVDLGLDTVLALAWDSARRTLFATGSGGESGLVVRLFADGSTDSMELAEAPTALWLDTERDQVVLAVRKTPVGGALVVLDPDSLAERDRFDFELPVGTPRRDGDDWVFYSTGEMYRLTDGAADPFFTIVEDYETGGDDGVVDIFVQGPGSYIVMQQGVGSDAATGMTYGTLHWLQYGEALRQLDCIGGPRHADLAVDRDVVVTPSGDTSSLVLTTAEGAQSRIKTGHSPSVVRSSPTDSSRFAVIDRLGGSVRIYNADDTWLSYESEGWPVDLVWDDDGTAVYVYENGRDALVRMDASTGVATTLWDDEGVNTALLFGSLTMRDGVIYVAAGGQEAVRAHDLDGALLWETSLTDPVGRDGPDRFKSMSIGVDKVGRIWTLDSLKGSVAILESDGSIIRQERLPEEVANDALYVGENTVYAGPYAFDLDNLRSNGQPVFDGDRVLVERDGVRLIDDDQGFGWEDGGARYTHTNHIYGGGYRAIWDPPTGGVWLSRFGVGELELVVED